MVARVLGLLLLAVYLLSRQVRGSGNTWLEQPADKSCVSGGDTMEIKCKYFFEKEERTGESTFKYEMHLVLNRTDWTTAQKVAHMDLNRKEVTIDMESQKPFLRRNLDVMGPFHNKHGDIEFINGGFVLKNVDDNVFTGDYHCDITEYEFNQALTALNTYHTDPVTVPRCASSSADTEPLCRCGSEAGKECQWSDDPEREISCEVRDWHPDPLTDPNAIFVWMGPNQDTLGSSSDSGDRTSKLVLDKESVLHITPDEDDSDFFTITCQAQNAALQSPKFCTVIVQREQLALLKMSLEEGNSTTLIVVLLLSFLVIAAVVMTAFCFTRNRRRRLKQPDRNPKTLKLEISDDKRISHEKRNGHVPKQTFAEDVANHYEECHRKDSRLPSMVLDSGCESLNKTPSPDTTSISAITSQHAVIHSLPNRANNASPSDTDSAIVLLRSTQSDAFSTPVSSTNTGQRDSLSSYELVQGTARPPQRNVHRGLNFQPGLENEIYDRPSSAQRGNNSFHGHNGDYSFSEPHPRTSSLGRQMSNGSLTRPTRLSYLSDVPYMDRFSPTVSSRDSQLSSLSDYPFYYQIDPSYPNRGNFMGLPRQIPEVLEDSLTAEEDLEIQIENNVEQQEAILHV